MPTVTVFRGLPGSGKTTEAKKIQAERKRAVRLSRDDIRENMFGSDAGILGQDDENWITKHLVQTAEFSLKAGFDVIVDSTNLRPKYVRDWHRLALRHGARFEVIDLRSNVKVQHCIGNDAMRYGNGGRLVGREVIEDLAKKFINKSTDYDVAAEEARIKEAHATSAPQQYVPDTTKPKAWMVDIDGTLAIHEPHRSPYDTSLYHLDTLNEPVARVVSALAAEGNKIVYLSGRHQDFKQETADWLQANHLPDGELFMREHPTRPDNHEKLDLFWTYVAHRYNIIGAIDDRKRVVEAWRSIGLTVLQVAEGDF